VKRGKPMRRTPLRRTSAKRDAANRQRRAVLAEAYPERPYCTVWIARMVAGLPPLPGCTRWGDDANEIVRRSQGGSITDLANINTPCRPCHDVITFTPRSQLQWARDLGLIANSGTEPKESKDG
jgi:hypothetical protein